MDTACSTRVNIIFFSRKRSESVGKKYSNESWAAKDQRRSRNAKTEGKTKAKKKSKKDPNRKWRPQSSGRSRDSSAEK